MVKIHLRHCMQKSTVFNITMTINMCEERWSMDSVLCDGDDPVFKTMLDHMTTDNVVYSMPQNVLQPCINMLQSFTTGHKMYFSHVQHATECTSVMLNRPQSVLQSCTTCHGMYFSQVQHATERTSVMYNMP